MTANDIIQRNAECARQLLEAGAEIERLKLYIKDLQINSPAKAALDEIERLTGELDLERRRLKTSEDLRTGLVGVIERLKAAIRTIEAQCIASTEPDYVAVPARLITEAVRALENKHDQPGSPRI